MAASHGKLDVLANVAGILQFGHAGEIGLEEWNRIIGVNLTGVFNMIRPALPHLLESRGNIVNVASTSGTARTALWRGVLGVEGRGGAVD